MISISGVKGYEYSEDIADGENGGAVIVKPIGNVSGNIGAAVLPGGNTGKFQYTFSSTEKVEAGTANWIDWDNGDVTSNTGATFTAPVTAVRGVSVSGAITIEVCV